MIQKLNHHKPQMAVEIRKIFQDSYAIEAEILKAVDFPPLKRTLPEYCESKTDFYGFYTNHILSAVVELNINNDSIHIQSLVVDPQYFRQAIASQLLQFVIENFNTPLLTVETGLNNTPAVLLYEKHGFVEIDQFDTNHGIRKVKFKRI